MQIHVVDSFFGFVNIRFVTVFALHKKVSNMSRVWVFRILSCYSKFLNNHSLLINHSGRRQGQGQDQDQGQGQGQDHEKVRRRGAPLQLQMVLALTLVLVLTLAPSGMINQKGMIIKKFGVVVVVAAIVIIIIIMKYGFLIDF